MDIKKDANMGFIKNNNYSLIEADKDHVIGEALITEESLNPFGICHGGFIFGLCDSAAGALAMMDGREAYTSSSTINYLKPCTGKKLTCYCTVIKAGKKMGVYEAKVFNEKEELCAVATVNYVYIK